MWVGVSWSEWLTVGSFAALNKHGRVCSRPSASGRFASQLSERWQLWMTCNSTTFWMKQLRCAAEPAISSGWLVVSTIFYFHPYLGKWSNLTNFFQMGWNHQLAGSYLPTLRYPWDIASDLQWTATQLVVWYRACSNWWQAQREDTFSKRYDWAQRWCLAGTLFIG